MVIPLWLRMTAAIGIFSIANLAQAYERPVLILSGGLGPGTKVFSSSPNLSISGRIEPTIEGGVEIRFFSILENGALHLIGGATAQINQTGTFGVNIFAPKAGWPLGKVRATVTFSPIRQVKAEFEIVLRKDEPPISLGEDKPPLDLGRILETADTRGKTIKVPAHSRFFIRGPVDKPNKKFISENGVTGPPVFGDVVRKESEKGKKTSFFQSVTISLAEKDRKGVYSYEWEVVSPHKAGLYEVRLTPLDEDEEYKKARTREEPDFILEVEGNVDLSR